jgi:hypothetical protein
MPKRRWLRGNTHTHTTYSDGDSPPEVAAEWYAEHGYDFLFFTDHNAIIPEPHLQRLGRSDLAVWQGEEITMGVVHMSGLGLRDLIVPREAVGTLAEAQATVRRAERVRWALEEIAAQGALGSLNHPNRWDALGHADLEEALDGGLLEIANMSPEAARANPGDLTRPSTEALWDRLLELGRPVFAVASDDAHHFRTWGPHRANPGRGWVMVEATEPRLDDCLAALRAGRFYASTGLTLADYATHGRQIALDLDHGHARFELIGPGGQVLEETSGASARFHLGDGVSYARVRAVGRDGVRLWTQPHAV